MPEVFNMRLRRTLPALAALFAAALALATRLSADFAVRWSEAVAKPILRALSRRTESLPFALLEWGLLALALALFGEVCYRWGRSGLRGALRRLARRLCGFALAVALMFAGLWLPLYPPAHSAGAGESLAASEVLPAGFSSGTDATNRLPQTAAPQAALDVDEACFTARLSPATPAQLEALCGRLIDELNAAAPDFDRVPEDLPAKLIDFPFWMRAFGITGFFSFPTGEALVTPELPDCALPFVAVHERMHANGIAGEGAANIAAWEDCMARGGTYADSARVWALKYAMDALSDADSSAWSACRKRMSEATAGHFRAVGGGTRSRSVSPGVQAAFAALGVGNAAGDYDILALYLAERIEI